MARALLMPGVMTARLSHVCVITANVPRLRDFYRDLLRAAPDEDRPEYVEFRTAGGALSMYRDGELDRYAPGAVRPESNRSVMIEFEVRDVDAEIARLARANIDMVMAPTTQPWGNRAAYLRDPDGNLVNLYTRVK